MTYVNFSSTIYINLKISKQLSAMCWALGYSPKLTITVLPHVGNHIVIITLGTHCWRSFISSVKWQKPVQIIHSILQNLRRMQPPAFRHQLNRAMSYIKCSKTCKSCKKDLMHSTKLCYKIFHEVSHPELHEMFSNFPHLKHSI